MKEQGCKHALLAHAMKSGAMEQAA